MRLRDDEHSSVLRSNTPNRRGDNKRADQTASGRNEAAGLRRHKRGIKGQRPGPSHVCEFHVFKNTLVFCLLGPLGVCPNLSDLQGIPTTNTGTTQSDDPKQTGGTPPDPQLNLSNLLNQFKVTKTGTGAESGKEATGGVYVGAGLSLVSYKLAQRIRQWEYIDMAELLPEVQLFGGAEDGRSGNRRPTVTDILTWIQCFGICVSTGSKLP